ncbi:hypothetical protein DRO26_02050, partial [Candidatus Bathyarchaeota archaeon]
DTEMMIGVAESLVENEGFNGKDMAKKFIKNFNVFRGYGPSPPEVLEWIEKGEPWDKASEKLFGGAGSYGNGGAMRVAPIGLFYHDDPKKLKLVAYQATQITHAHPLGKEGAALQAYAISLTITLTKPLNKEVFLQNLNDFVESKIYKEKIRLVKDLLNKKAKPQEVVFKLGNGIEAFNSVPTAIYSFLANLESFKESVVYAVNLGGDTDTLGAMTGGLSGSYHGIEKIPQRWKEKLENRVYIESLAEKLWEIKLKVSSKNKYILETLK